MQTLAEQPLPVPELAVGNIRTDLTLEIIRWAIWEMEAINLRHALLQMDRACRRDAWEREENTRELAMFFDWRAPASHLDMDWESGDQRRVRLAQELSQLWGGESLIEIDPSRPPAGLFAEDWRTRREAVTLLRRYLFEWSGTWIHGIDLRVQETTETEEQFNVLELATVMEFVKQFWKRFRQPIPIPRRRPSFPGSIQPREPLLAVVPSPPSLAGPSIAGPSSQTLDDPAAGASFAGPSSQTLDDLRGPSSQDLDHLGDIRAAGIPVVGSSSQEAFSRDAELARNLDRALNPHLPPADHIRVNHRAVHGHELPSPNTWNGEPNSWDYSSDPDSSEEESSRKRKRNGKGNGKGKGKKKAPY